MLMAFGMVWEISWVQCSHRILQWAGAWSLCVGLQWLFSLSALLIWMSKANDNSFELTISIIISTIALTTLLIYYSLNIINFLNMIKRQEKQYITTFDDKNPKVFSKYSLWIICSDNWLIYPGRLAIYRKEIKSASIGETYHVKGSTVYPVEIKTLSGKVFNLKIKNEKDARKVRIWARQ